MFPLIARDYALGLQAENRRRAERGDAPLPLEDMLAEALKRSTGDVVQKTHWPNIDLIGAQLNLYWAEFQIPVWRMALRGWKLWEALSNALDRDGVLDALRHRHARYPAGARVPDDQRADRCGHPAGAARAPRSSSSIRPGRFFDMLHSTFASIEDGENLAARALGRDEIRFEWDAIRAIVTRYDAGQQAELAGLMQAYLGRMLSPWRQEFTALVGQAGEQVNGIYEADYRDFNRDTYARGRHDLRPDLRRLQAAAARGLAPRRARRRRRPGEGDRLMARRRLTPTAALLQEDVPRAEHPRAPRAARRRRRSPGSPPRPPARRRSRRWPRRCAGRATRGGWCSSCRSTAIAADHLAARPAAGGGRRRRSRCASRSGCTASGRRSR